MLITKIRSKVALAPLIKVLDPFDAIIIDPTVVESTDELLLSEALTKKSFETKENIANKFKYEFLLWICGKRDIKSALEISLPTGNEAILIIFEGDKKEILEKLEAKIEKLQLKKEIDPMRLEKISLSRVM